MSRVANHWAIFGVLSAFGAAVLVDVHAWRGTLQIDAARRAIAHSQSIKAQLITTLSALQDVETGGRGFVITGEEPFLEPYRAAARRVDEEMARLESLFAETPELIEQLNDMRLHMSRRRATIDEQIEARRSLGGEAARAMVATGVGKREMDAFRADVNRLYDRENGLLNQREAELDRAVKRVRMNYAMTGVAILALLALVGVLVRREQAARRRFEGLIGGQKEVLEMIATGAALQAVLERIVLLIESRSRDLLGSILLLDEDGTHVRHGAAPGLPEAYSMAIDGQPIGPAAGSCGTAAFRKEPVFVKDIATDPLWKSYREVALRHGLRACWSTPVFDDKQHVLGTFAMYFRNPGLPTDTHLKLIDVATHLASVAIGRWRSEKALSDSRHRLTAAERLAHVGNWSYEVATGRIVWSDELYRIFGLEPQSEMISYERLLSMVHPDDRVNHDAYTEQLRAARPGDEIELFEYRAVRPDGSIAHVVVRVDVQGDSQGRSERWFGTVQDVTERKLAEEAAAERNRLAQQVSMIATTAPGALASFRLQPDGGASFPYASAAWLSLFSVTREEVAADASALNRRIHPDDLAHFRATIQESARSMKDWRDEFRVLHPTRGELWVEGHSTPVREPDGSILWHGFITEITERKLAETALRESEERFAGAFNASPAAISITRVADGRIIDVNQAFLDLFEFTREEVIGHTSSELGMVSAAERSRLIAEAERLGTARNVDYSARSKSGREIQLLFSANPMTVGGEPLFITTSIDITQRKQAEAALVGMVEKFDLAARAAGLGVWDWDVVNDQLIWDDRMYELYGLHNKNFSGAYDAWLKGVHPEDRERGELEAQSALRGEREYDTEFRVIWPDGTIRHLKAFARVVRDGSGKPQRMTGINYDITARKQAELERQKFYLLAESSSEFIGMCDLDLNPLYVNPAGVRMVGLADMAAACRVKVQDYFFPEDQAFIESEFFPRVLREGDGDVEIRLRHFQTGEPIWMFYYLFRVRDAGGQAVGWATVSRDITERKRAERELIESERRYRALFENMTAGFVLFEVVCDELGKPSDLTILAANQGFEGTTGLGPSEVVGRRLTEVLPGIERDDADWIGRYGNVAIDGRPRQFEQGSELLGVYYSVTAYQAAPGQCAVTFVDVTDRRKAEAELRDREARLRLSVKASNIGLWDWDLRTNEVHFSAEWKSQIGFGEDEVSNDFSEWERRVHPEDLAPTLEKVQSFLRNPVGSHSAEFRFLHRDGTYRWIFTHADIMKDESGKAIRMLGCHIDVTERKRSEERLRALTARLEATREEERTRIAREIHDVLGQLLTGLKMDISSIGRSVRNGGGVPEAEAVSGKVGTAIGLVDELIATVQRIAAELRPSVLDNLGLAAAVTFEARRFAERSGIACDTSDVPDSIFADPDVATGVFRVFQELLTNVARHSGASRVRIRLMQSEEDVTLEVCDDGRGIRAAEVDQAASLGLLGMRERARLLNGTFSISGSPERGTTAVLTIPARSVDQLEEIES